VRDAPGLLVAEQLTVRCNGLPQEGEQQPAPYAGVFAPILALELISRNPVAAGVGDERRIDAREYLLPAHAVGDHQDDVLRFRRPCGRCAGNGGESDEKQLRESGHRVPPDEDSAPR
jgi:hypothetical protein